MALINDQRLYTGGSERFDTRPHVQLYAQLKAKEQANKDAFDEYMRNLNIKVNPAGMRNNERRVFEDKLSKWQQYGMQNKEQLRNPRKDGGRASMEFQAGYQDLQNIIARSKGVEELKKPAVEVITDPNKYDRVNKDKLKTALQSTDQDLYIQDPKTGAWVDNPEWRGISVSDIEFNAKPFDQGKFRGLFKDIKRQEQAPTMIKDSKNMTQTVTKRAVFDEPAKDQIAEIAVTEYMSDPSTKEFIDKLDPSEYNDFFKKNYGHDIQTEGDLAAAYALKTQQEELITSELKDDLFAQRKAMAELNDAYAKGRMYMRRAWSKADKATQDTWVDGQIDGIIAKGKQGGEVVYTDENDNKRLGFKLPLDPTMAKALTRDKQEPDALRLNSDGTIQPVFLIRDDSGKAVRGKKGEYEINKTLSVPLTREQIRAAYSRQFGVKQANLEMGGMDGDGDERSSGSETIGILD